MAMARYFDLRWCFCLCALFYPFILASVGGLFPAPFHNITQLAEGSVNPKSEGLSSGDIDHSLDLLQRAGGMLVNGSYCNADIATALKELLYVKESELKNEYDQAQEQLQRAKKALSQCKNTLILMTIVALKTSVLLLIKEALHTIDIVSASIDISQIDLAYVSNETMSTTATQHSASYGQPGGQFTFGTECQFSEEGLGRLLPSCAFGFASGVTGGLHGQSYIVTSSGDNPKNPQQGTLRYGVNKGGGYHGGVWITFERDMLIELYDYLWVKSFTTIDGRGVNVTLTRKSILVSSARNVILHNFQINSIRNSDTVHIFDGSSKIWVDHITSFNAERGLVSVVQGATDVTISNCYLSNSNFNMLLGASDYDYIDSNMRVTVYRNWFKDSYQRMPHCRLGYCHVINNLYSNWGFYAIGARAHATLLSEKNAFVAGERKEITPWFIGGGTVIDETSTIQSLYDLFLDGATFHQFLRYGKAKAPPYTSATQYPSIHPTPTLEFLIRRCAGAQFGPNLKRCLHGHKLGDPY